MNFALCLSMFPGEVDVWEWRSSRSALGLVDVAVTKLLTYFPAQKPLVLGSS